jgi:hypothetical protein
MAVQRRSSNTGSTRRKPVVKATGSSVWAQKLGDNELFCRDLGHVWASHNASENERKRIFTQALRCPRCGTIRTRMISSISGEILASHYTYPQTYLAPTGVGRMSAGVRGELRVSSIRRVIEAAQSAAAKTAALSTNVVSISNGNKK